MMNTTKATSQAPFGDLRPVNEATLKLHQLVQTIGARKEAMMALSTAEEIVERAIEIRNGARDAADELTYKHNPLEPSERADELAALNRELSDMLAEIEVCLMTVAPRDL